MGVGRMAIVCARVLALIDKIVWYFERLMGGK
jgi:hypothetical protein